MAISTYKVFLMKGTTSDNTTTYSKLIDIKEFPNLGDAPELLDKTTLSEKMRTYILGIQENEGMTFTANYTKTDYSTLKELEGSDLDLAVWFGGTESGGVVTPSGSDGKFTFKGEIFTNVNGGGVNEVVNMTITVAPTSVITFA